MKVLYFAWLRERVGRAEETVEPPAEVVTVADLARWLAAQDEAHAHAFENPAVVRAALDRRHVKPDAPIAGVREIAFFPPMTGG
jgi:molybdopterin synthase sulfur carrier subunit